MRPIWVRPPGTGNNSPLLSDNGAAKPLGILNIHGVTRMIPPMMRHTLTLVVLALLTALPLSAQAACYADYKARRDSPLKLHYGVMQVSSCNRAAASREVEARLARNGWTLLNVLGVFDDAGLEGRKANAGQYYLRF